MCVYIYIFLLTVIESDYVPVVLQVILDMGEQEYVEHTC